MAYVSRQREERRHARVNEWVSEWNAKAFRASQEKMATTQWHGGGKEVTDFILFFYVQAALSPETSSDFRVTRLSASDINWKYLCLYAFLQLKTFFLSFNKTYLLFNKWTPTPHFTFPQCYLPNQTQPLQDLKLGQLEGEKVCLLWNCVCKDWLWPKPQELETVCELTRHRQVQAEWGKKLLPGFSSCRLQRPLMFYVLFSWRWLINVWQQSKKG